MAVRIDVADAVVSQLNAATWSPTFTAERAHAKQAKTLAQLTTLVVEVVPRPLEMTLENRGGMAKVAMVDIYLRQKMQPSQQDITDGSIPTDETDSLETLAEDIAESFTPLQGTTSRTGRLTDYDNAAFQSVRIMTGEVQDQFAKTRVWQAQIRLTFVI